MNVLIIGTGPSILKRTLPLKADIVIAVNQALRIPYINPNIWFTLDPSDRNLQLINEAIPVYKRCKFIVACGHNIQLPATVYRVDRVSDNLNTE